MDDTAAPTRRRGPYRKQFDRDTEQKIALTVRDLDIFHWLAKYRFLTTRQILALTAAPDILRRRLNTLHKAGFIDRPIRQTRKLRDVGRVDLVYALGSRGARVLARERRQQLGDDWGYKNNQVGSDFIDHTTATSEFMVGLETLVRTLPQYQLLDEEALLRVAPASTRARKPHVPTKWSTKIDWDGRGTVEEMAAVPDAVFALATTDGTPSVIGVVEIDTGSMPVMRSERKLSSIKRKIAVYHKAYREQYHTKTFGWRACRFLFVTTSAERARSICDCVATVTGGKSANAFWVIDWETLKSGTLLDVPWTLGSGAVDVLIK